MKQLVRIVLAVACLGPLAVFIMAVLSAAGVGPALAQEEKPDPFTEIRYCGPPPRDAAGTIIRSSKVLYAFRKAHPCPANGSRFGACPRWQINHIWPLDKGGCDAVYNLQWLPVEVKTCAHPWCVDRWERVYWGEEHGLVPAWPAPAASAP